MRLLDRPELTCGQLEGFFPTDCLPTVSHSLMGCTQPVRIVLDVLQGHCLRTDVAAAEAVVMIALYRGDAWGGIRIVGDFQGQAANGFTQMTGTVMQGLVHGHLLLGGLG
ncbi:hypothetical protein D3C77_677060 [compost metagenome]